MIKKLMKTIIFTLKLTQLNVN